MMMKAQTGQTLVDSLMLILALSIVILFLGFFLGQESVRAQSLRYDSQQHQSGILSALNKYVTLENASGDVVLRGRIIDALIYQTCHGCPNGSSAYLNYCPDLEKEVNKSISEINSGKKHYIFQSNSTKVYDNKSSVCLDYISVARLTYNSECGEFGVIYGTWFTWMDPPEEC